MTYVGETYHAKKYGYMGSDSGTWFSIAFYCYFLLLIFCSAIYNFFRLTGISMFAKLCQKYVIFPTVIPKGKFSQPYGFNYFFSSFQTESSSSQTCSSLRRRSPSTVSHTTVPHMINGTNGLVTVQVSWPSVRFHYLSSLPVETTS